MAVTINIGANNSQLNAAFQQSQAVVTAALDRMDAALKKLSGQSDQTSAKVVRDNKAIANSFTDAGAKTAAGAGAAGAGLMRFLGPAALFATALIAIRKAVQGLKETIESLDAIDDLSENMGISVETAQTYIAAVTTADLTLDAFQGTLQKTSAMLSKNEAILTRWGVATRDSNGDLVAQAQLFENVRARVGSYVNGVDRAAAAQKLWGVDLETANKLLRLTPEALEVARQKAEAFGNTLSDEAKAGMDDFKRSSGDLELAMGGLRNAFYEEVLPAVTSLMNFVSANAPAGLQKMRDMGRGVVETFQWVGRISSYIFDQFTSNIDKNVTASGARLLTFGEFTKNVASIIEGAIAVAVGVISLFTNTVANFFGLVGDGISNMAAAMSAAADGDLQGVKDAFSKNFDDASTRLDNWSKDSVETVKKTIADMHSALMGEGLGALPGTPPWLAALNNGLPADAPDGTRRITNETIKGGGGGGANTEATERVKAQTALMRAELKVQLDLLKQNLDAQKAALDDALAQNTVSYTAYYTRVTELAKAENAKQLELIEAQIVEQEKLKELAKSDTDRLRIQSQIVALQGQVNLLKLKEGEIEAANARALRDKLEEMRKLKVDLAAEVAAATGVTDVGAQFAQVEEQYRGMKNRLAAEGDVEGLSLLERLMGFKKAELELRSFEDQYNLFQQNMQTKMTELDTLGKSQGLTDYTMQRRKMDLYAEEVTKLIEIKEAQLAVAEAAYGANSAQVAGIKSTIAELKNMKQPIAEVAKAIKEGITSNFSTFFNDVMSGTKSIKDAFKDLVDNIVASINRVVAEALAKRLMYAFEGGSGGGGGIAGAIGGLFGGGASGASGGGGGMWANLLGSLFGGRANGGFVATGMPYLVGENGPEIFVPRTSGNVMSNTNSKNAMSGGSGGVVQHVTIVASDPHSFGKTRSQWMADLSNSVSRASNRNN